jgi:hypothetical protein
MLMVTGKVELQPGTSGRFLDAVRLMRLQEFFAYHLTTDRCSSAEVERTEERADNHRQSQTTTGRE